MVFGFQQAGDYSMNQLKVLLPQGYSIAFPAIALLVDQRELRCPRVWPATTDLFGFSKGLAAWLGVVTTVWVTIIITHKQSGQYLGSLSW